jgi:hypothetical protein
MYVDAGQVLKRAVLCRQCNEEYLFTLRAIAEQAALRCPPAATVLPSAITPMNRSSAR